MRTLKNKPFQSVFTPVFSKVIYPIFGNGLEPSVFEFTIDTMSTKLFNIPTLIGGDYDCWLDNGNGDAPVHIDTWNDPAWIINYTTDGVKTIKIWGDKFEGFSFDTPIANNNNKIRNVVTAGLLELISGGACFFGCPSLTWSAVDAINKNTGLPADMRWTWEACTSLTAIASVNASDWSNVTNAEGCFDSDILLNQAMTLNTSSNVNFKWFTYGCAAQTALITVNYVSAENCEGQYEDCILYNQPIVFATGPAGIPMIDLKDFLKNANSWNQEISNMGWQYMSNLEGADGFIEGTSFDRDANVPLAASDVRKFFKDTPIGDRTITMNFANVDFAQDIFKGCFSQTTLSWSDFLEDLQDNLLSLNNNVRIDAEAQHNSNGHDAISDIASTKNWLFNDGGHDHI